MAAQRFFKNPLFLDIETISCAASFGDLAERFQNLWRKKARTLGATTPEEEESLFEERAGIFAEFGKVIVIAVGYVSEEGGRDILSVKALYGHDEKALLLDFKRLIEKFSAARGHLQLCAHNGKEFDFPYLCRRMVVHGILWPETLSLQGKKPWEVNHVDTKEMWKFGDYKNYTSLDLLTALFDVPSSKNVMDGSEVSHYYYKKKDLETLGASSWLNCKGGSIIEL